MGKKEISKNRELNPVERERVLKLHQRKGGRAHEPRNSNLFCEIKEGESNFNFITQDEKRDLSHEDAVDEFEARLMEATGLCHVLASSRLLIQCTEALVHKGADHKEFVRKINEVALQIQEFDPKDAIEGNLCAQVVVCQEKAMSLIGRSSNSDHPEVVKIYSNMALKLFARSQSAIQSLISYRRGGQQKVTVEHVNVESGGQAIVGNVIPPERKTSN